MSEHLKKLNEQDRSEQLTVQDITYATEHFGDAEWKEVVNALEDGLWETFQGHIDQLYSELSYQLEDLETLSSQDVELLQLCAFMKQRFEGVKYGYEGEASKKISIDGKVGRQTRAIIKSLVPHYNTYHELATASSTKKELLAQSILVTYPTPKIKELFKDQAEYILTFAQEQNKEQKEALTKYDETLDILNQYFQDESFSISSDVSQEEYRSAYPDQSSIMDRNMMVAESTAVNNILGSDDYNLSSIPSDVVRLTLNGGESFVVKIDEDLQQELIQRKKNEESIVLRTTSDNQTESHNRYFGFQNGYELSTDNFSIIDQEDNGTLLVKNRDGKSTKKISPQESIKALDVESSVHNQLHNNADIKLMKQDMENMQSSIAPLQELMEEFSSGGLFSHMFADDSNEKKDDLGIDKKELQETREKAVRFQQEGLVYIESQVPHWQDQKKQLENLLSDIDDNSPLVGMQRQIQQMIDAYDNLLDQCTPSKDGQESQLRQFTEFFLNPAQFYENSGMSWGSFVNRAKINGPALLGAIIGTVLVFTGVGTGAGIGILSIAAATGTGMVVGKGLQIASNHSSILFDNTIEVDGKTVTLDFDNPTNVELYRRGKIDEKQLASSLVQEFTMQFVMQLVFMKGIQGASKAIHTHIASYPKGSVAKMLRIIKPTVLDDLTKGFGYDKGFGGKILAETTQETFEELGEEFVDQGSKVAGLGTLAVFLFGLYNSISPRSARGGNKNFFQENNITQVGELSMTGNVALQKLEINSLAESDKVIEFYKQQGFSVVEQSDGGITFEKKAVLDGEEGVQRVKIKEGENLQVEHINDIKQKDLFLTEITSLEEMQSIVENNSLEIEKQGDVYVIKENSKVVKIVERPKIKSDLDLYFKKDLKAIEISTKNVVQDHVSNDRKQMKAEFFMFFASKGNKSPRKPLDAIGYPGENGEMMYYIMDGNTTTSIALDNNFPLLRVKSKNLSEIKDASSLPYKLYERLVNLGHIEKPSTQEVTKLQESINEAYNELAEIYTGNPKLIDEYGQKLLHKDDVAQLFKDGIISEDIKNKLESIIQRFEKLRNFSLHDRIILDEFMDSNAQKGVVSHGEGVELAGSPTDGNHNNVPIKGAKRGLENLFRKFGGKIQRLTDLARGTMEYSDYDSLHQGLFSICNSLGIEMTNDVLLSDYIHVLQIKENNERYKKGVRSLTIKNNVSFPKGGYRDISLKLELENGRSVELQLNTHNMLLAKEKYVSVVEEKNYKDLLDKLELSQKDIDQLEESHFKKTKKRIKIFQLQNGEYQCCGHKLYEVIRSIDDKDTHQSKLKSKLIIIMDRLYNDAASKDDLGETELDAEHLHVKNVEGIKKLRKNMKKIESELLELSENADKNKIQVKNKELKKLKEKIQVMKGILEGTTGVDHYPGLRSQFKQDIEANQYLLSKLLSNSGVNHIDQIIDISGLVSKYLGGGNFQFDADRTGNQVEGEIKNTPIISNISEYLASLDFGTIVDKEGEKSLLIMVESFVTYHKQSGLKLSDKELFDLMKRNIDSVLYQQINNAKYLAGSDHGINHIIDGNMKNAIRLMDEMGDNISSKEKFMVLQMIVDHDVGYAHNLIEESVKNGSSKNLDDFYAQAKDHPLFSRKYVDDYAGYYESIFGEDFHEMKKSMLDHSKVRSTDLQNLEGKERGEVLQMIIASVDCLGVSHVDKLSPIYREKKMMSLLHDIHKAQRDFIGEKKEEKLKTIKGQMIQYIKSHPTLSIKHKELYLHALEKTFNESDAGYPIKYGFSSFCLTPVDVTIGNGKMIVTQNLNSNIYSIVSEKLGEKIALNNIIKQLDDYGLHKDDIKNSIITVDGVSRPFGFDGIVEGSEIIIDAPLGTFIYKVTNDRSLSFLEDILEQ